MLRKLIITCLYFLGAVANAKVPIDSVVSMCRPYPENEDKTSYPAQFNITNNLARAQDNGLYEAEGQKIIIYGRVLDRNCLPVSDAKIYIWQANKEGYVQYPIAKPNNFPHHQKWIDPNFIGTGITNSDNLGRFQFITIMPGSFTKVTPHIHFIVKHDKLESLSSKFYLVKGKQKIIYDTDEDNKLFTLTKRQIIDQMTAVSSEDDKSYMIDITLDGELENKKY
jgi:protocatechuate 3,4-dioxygenase beta subunit